MFHPLLINQINLFNW